MIKIRLSNSPKSFIIDNEDYGRVIKYKWYVGGRNESTISTIINNVCILLNRYLLNYTGQLNVDHKDRNFLNNQKNNLRLATQSQNQANNFYTNNTSGYKGVCWKADRAKWYAQIRVNHQQINIGSFRDIKDAARAYNQAAIKHFGEFAWLNKIKD